MNTDYNLDERPPVDPYTLLSTLRLDALRYLRHDPQIGPLVVGDGAVDGYTLTRMLPAVPGWKVVLGNDPAVVVSLDDHAGIAVTATGRLIAVGISEDAAMTLLRSLQATFLAVQLEMDEAQEPFLV
jgi:hypothetical protein